MSIGMDPYTGLSVSELEHLRQSITKILTTPVGSRIKRRPFGSLWPELIDHPTNDQTIIQLYAATATALVMHEPRFRLTRVQLAVNAAMPGKSTLELEGIARLGGRSRRAAVSIPAFEGLSA